ncbi:MAG: L,D-transpeptidase [Chloroflexota bacterium]
MISRRDFLKLTALGLGSLALRPLDQLFRLPDFLPEERLGRVLGKVNVRSRPDYDSVAVNVLYEDAIVPWYREAVGYHPYTNQRWVETSEGYIWLPLVQPVRNLPNIPRETLPETSLGAGMWTEVTVPYVDLILANPEPLSPWLKATDRPRLYYSQVLWVDQVKTDSVGQVWYRINERYGSYGDIFWAAAEGFRPINVDEIAPLNPQAENKRVVVDVNYQTLSCYEDDREVYFCRISTGAKFDAEGNPVDKWSTPTGRHPIWRKLISLHMSGGTTGGGYDLPGIGWTALFVGSGIALHSTYWHNDFGVPRSHGCVNIPPEDAKWVWRWTLPHVEYDPGDITVTMPGGTTVEVVEG